MLDDKDINNYLQTINKLKSTSSSSQNNVQPSVAIDPSCDIRGIERMKFGNDVVIQNDCWLNIVSNNPEPGPMIIIGEGTNIGRRCTISAANKISIGKYVLFAPNVFVADTHHEYQKLGIPIMYQGITTQTDSVTIEDESWIGINAVIMGNVKIGKHCVIGANSVVTKNIPPYCVAVGNPAKVIKIFDVITVQWVNIKDQDDLNNYLAIRDKNIEENKTKVSG